MAMSVLGAAVNLPTAELPKDPSARKGILAVPRPYQGDHRMIAETAVQAIEDALLQANTNRKDIDLMITLGASPSHMADSPDILGPRFGHPIQRDMGINNAFVFDILDGDMNFAMDIAESFFNLYPFKRALLIYGECSAPGVRACKETGMALADGVSAWVVGPDETRSQMGASYEALDSGFRPLVMHPLSPNEISNGLELVELRFQAPPEFLENLRESTATVTAQESSRHGGQHKSETIHDAWFDLNPGASGGEGAVYQGPHALTVSMNSFLASPEDECPVTHVLATTFNPFKMRVGCRALRLRRKS